MGNTVIHVEVVGKDGPKLQKFYSDVLGWSLDTNNPGGYGMNRDTPGLTAGGGPSCRVVTNEWKDHDQNALDRALRRPRSRRGGSQGPRL